jgi:hypothetical protein
MSGASQTVARSAHISDKWTKWSSWSFAETQYDSRCTSQRGTILDTPVNHREPNMSNAVAIVCCFQFVYNKLTTILWELL